MFCEGPRRLHKVRPRDGLGKGGGSRLKSMPPRTFWEGHDFESCHKAAVKHPALATAVRSFIAHHSSAVRSPFFARPGEPRRLS
jgi:hypothetical protein